MTNGQDKQPQAAEAIEAIETIETPLLLEAMFQRYGYDFREYAPASLRRRLRRAMQIEGLATLSAFQDRILRDSKMMARFLNIVSVDVTAMFRDPGFYRTFRDKVVPGLREQPLIRFWHVGCATGEEVYSMAIILHEEGLLERTRIYATDINPRGIECGQNAIYPIRNMQEFTTSYQKAGGRAAFSDYYTARGDSIILRDFLRRNIVWAEHNLVTDASFNEFHAILCRNVMIYFKLPLQQRVHQLIYDSLVMGGALGLGSAESLRFTPLEDHYEPIGSAEKLYRKVK
ncbi:MAG: protein-glutamate O-methyltransferase CheR [Nitrosomonadaceae bacterium]|nr:protein-glutamate O-methyltransferase CheR [Nitrosomonadaceae bacterium]